MFTVFLNGITTGLLLQIAVGPVFFYILNIAFHKTVADGFCAVIAVTAADYIYIILSLFGVGKLLEKSKTKVILGIISAFVLIACGIIMITTSDKSFAISSAGTGVVSNYWGSFLSTFLLTISSPMTIIFWTSLFATKAIENNYSKEQLFVFGFSAGLATLIILGLSVIIFSIVKTSIPIGLFHYLNILVGVILIAYALLRLLRLYNSKV